MTSPPEPGAASGVADAPLAPPLAPFTLSQRVARGSAAYGFANFALKGLSFFLLALYTRFLTPADYGVIALAETVAMLAAIVSGLGMSAASRRLYFQYAGDRGSLDPYVSTILRFGAVATVAIMALCLALGPAVMRLMGPRFAVPFYPYVAIALGTAAALQLVDYRLGLYQTEEQPRNFVLLSTASALATAVAVVALVIVVRRGAVGMLEGKLIAAAGMAVVAVALSWPRIRARFRWTYVKETLPLALPLIPHQFMALGLVVADRFILQRYRSLDEVGWYSLAYTFGMAMYLVTTSVMQAWSPLFYQSAAQGEPARQSLGKIGTLLVAVLSAAAVLGIAVSQPFVRWAISPAYHQAGRLIPWIIAGYLMHALFSLFQLAALQGKKTGRIWLASGMALAANLILNFVLIPPLGAYGAAYATLAAYGIEAGLMYGLAQSAFAVRYRGGRILLCVVIVGAVLAGSQWQAPSALLWAVVLLLGALALLWLAAGLSFSELRY